MERMPGGMGSLASMVGSGRGGMSRCRFAAVWERLESLRTKLVKASLITANEEYMLFLV
jgi:hypothetical protein